MRIFITTMFLVLCSTFTVKLQAQQQQQQHLKGKQTDTKKMETRKNDFSLVGKKGILTFSGMTAYVTYSSDSTLHWKTVNAQGVTNEGDEKISYKRLTENLHFLNWIEKDGFTVSQVIDTQNGTVKGFWSFNDAKSERGGRTAMFVDGKFVFEK